MSKNGKHRAIFQYSFLSDGYIATIINKA